jgi:hypothetical protein
LLYFSSFGPEASGQTILCVVRLYFFICDLADYFGGALHGQLLPANRLQPLIFS